MSYSKAFSSNMGHHFTRSTIRLTALTGAAATQIGGQTSAKEFHLLEKKRAEHGENDDELREWQDTRLNIVDEVSFGGVKDFLEPLNEKLGNFTQRPDIRFGSSAIVFLGDFCQLPCFSQVIYEKDNNILWHQALNCMRSLAA